jgi:hypothetical protein
MRVRGTDGGRRGVVIDEQRHTCGLPHHDAHDERCASKDRIQVSRQGDPPNVRIFILYVQPSSARTTADLVLGEGGLVGMAPLYSEEVGKVFGGGLIRRLVGGTA